MVIEDFFKRLETTNNHWPEYVHVLYSHNSNLIDPSVPSDPAWPTTMNAWVAFEFRKLDKSSNYAAQLDWWSVYNTMARWETKYPNPYRAITHPNDYFALRHWNARMLLRYNATWAYFGYIDNQDQRAITYAEYLHTSLGAEQLNDSRGPVPTYQNQYGTFTDYIIDKSEAKPYGKKEAKPKIKKSTGVRFPPPAIKATTVVHKPAT